MTIGIAGPAAKQPGRSVVVGFIIAAIILGAGLTLLGLVVGFLVDWMWFSSIGYLQVFWTTVSAKAAVGLVVFAATAAVVWANVRLALGLATRRTRAPAAFDPNFPFATPPDPLAFMRERLPWHRVIAAGAGLIALLVAWGEVDNWSVLLQWLYHVP